MNLGPRLLRHTALLVLLPAIALAGCQAPSGPTPTALTNAPDAQRGNVQIVLGGAKQAKERSVLGLGFADTAIVAARVTVMGADMVKESKTVAWDGQSALNVSLNVPVGNCRLFILEALDADPATATSEPGVRAVIRGAANVGAAASVTVNLNYNSDAIGRVLESLNETLAYGAPMWLNSTPLGPAPVPTTSPVPDARKLELTTALTSATFLGEVETFVTKITKYTAPTTMEPNGAYAGINPLYFNADHLVGLLVANGASVVQGNPPLPLEAFRASGTLMISLNNATQATLDPKTIKVTLQVPFAEYKESGAFLRDTGNSTSGTWGTYVYKDVPPGRWGVIATMDGKVIGSDRVRVRHGDNGGNVTVYPPEVATLSGMVTDEDGAPVDGAAVTITSLNPDFPYEATVETVAGEYQATNVPAGVQVRVRATSEGFTTRERIKVLAVNGLLANSNRVSFGSDMNDSTGGAFFISDFPEVVSAVPSTETLAGDELSYDITLSEALDPTNRARFEDAIRLITDASFISGPIELEVGSTFASPDRQLTATWDADGKVVTLAFNAPLARSEDDTLTYRLRLLRGAAASAITDDFGNPFGLNAPSAGSYYTDVFKLANLPLTFGPTSDAERWADTHTDSASFDVAMDATDPTLESVSVSTLADRTRINLRFSEPMAVAGGFEGDLYGVYFPGFQSVESANPPADLLGRFTFAIAETSAELAGVTLGGGSPVSFAANTVLGDTASERLVEFVLSAGSAPMEIYLNPDDPLSLRIEVMNPNLFGTEVNAIKARVEGITDPTGNAITESSADANVRVGTI